MSTSQSAPAVLLVRPAHFGHNPLTAASNVFQQRPGALQTNGELHPGARARAECEALCDALRSAGVRVCLIEDTPEPPKPDAVFPNNWISWHADGTVVLYPMMAVNRRAERRLDIVAAVSEQLGFERRRLLDLSGQEQRGRYLEGTGSLVLDRIERVAYACRSARTDESVVREWAALMDYEPLVFDASEGEQPIYHTNVMLAMGTRWALVCTEAISPIDRSRVRERLQRSGRELIEIPRAALRAFAGNILELAPPGRRVLALSAKARGALSEHEGWSRLRACVDEVVAVDVPTIERIGGGSVRCMLAEVPAVDS
jgi:hypothetical protein